MPNWLAKRVTTTLAKRPPKRTRKRRAMILKKPLYVASRRLLRIKKVINGAAITNYATSASGGSITANNGGFLTIATPATQNNFYYSIGYSFSLADIPEVGSYKILYDRYKINKIVFRLYPLYNTASPVQNVVVGAGAAGTLESGNGNLAGMMYSEIDYNDAAALTATDTGFNDFRNRPSVRIHNILGSKPFTRTIYPRIAVAAYDASVAFTGYKNDKASWMDTLSPSDTILHYGIKWGFELINPNAAVNYLNYKVEATYYVSFKDPK